MFKLDFFKIKRKSKNHETDLKIFFVCARSLEYQFSTLNFNKTKHLTYHSRVDPYTKSSNGLLQICLLELSLLLLKISLLEKKYVYLRKLELY